MDAEEVLVVGEVGGFHDREEYVSEVSAIGVDLDMRDDAVDADIRSVRDNEVGYMDFELENDSSQDEGDDDASASVLSLGYTALLGTKLEGLEPLSYVCIVDDDTKLEEGPKAALEKLLSEESAIMLFEAGIE